MKTIETSNSLPCDRLFLHLVLHGASAFEATNSLSKYKDKKLLDRLIDFFEKKQDFEKCCFLKIIRDNLNTKCPYNKLFNSSPIK
jgi:hypothetical protein